MSPFASPMFLAPTPATTRRYFGQDYARRDAGYGARYARRATPAPLAASVVAWPAWASATLARVGDAWVLQEQAQAA